MRVNVCFHEGICSQFRLREILEDEHFYNVSVVVLMDIPLRRL